MKKKKLSIHPAEIDISLELPLAGSKIKAGFPSPAEDFLDTGIDLNKELIKNPASTFLGKVSGDSMQDLGISDGDIVVIDKSKEVVDGKIVVCFIDGEFTMKTIKFEEDFCWLMPANEKYQPLKVTKDNEFIVWGIVTHVIKSF